MKYFFKISKEKLNFFCFLFLFLLLTVFIHSNSYSFDFKIGIPEYLYTQWVFNYDYGFVRRALPGEIYNLLDIDPSYINVRIFTVFLFSTLFCLFSTITYKFLKNLKFNSKSIIIYLACILGLSFTVTQFLREISRFDQIGQILFLILLILITKKVKSIYIFPLILIYIPIIALIHEAMIIFFVPPLLYIYYIQYNRKTHIILASIVAFISILMIIIYGKMSSYQANSIIETFTYYKGFQSYAVNTSLLDLKENAITNLSTFFSTKAYIKIFFSILYSLPFIYFIKKSTNKIQFIMILFFSASPLALILIAFDYLRWYSLFLFNLSAIFMSLSILNKVNNDLIILNFKKYKNAIYTYSFASFLLGSLGIGSIFPGLYDNNNPWEKREDWDYQTLIKLNDPMPKLDILLTINDDNLNTYRHILSYKLPPEEIIHYYINESKKGNSSIQNTLGYMYFYGLGTPINYCSALKEFQKSATKNNHNALNNLSYMYRYGICTKQNTKTANNLLIKAANYGNPVSKITVARGYIYGFNKFPINYHKGMQLLNELSKAGNLPATILLNSLQNKK